MQVAWYLDTDGLPLAFVIDEEKGGTDLRGAQQLLLGGIRVGPPTRVSLDERDVAGWASGHACIVRDGAEEVATGGARRLGAW
jgi:hypothetical protein